MERIAHLIVNFGLNTVHSNLDTLVSDILWSISIRQLKFIEQQFFRKYYHLQ